MKVILIVDAVINFVLGVLLLVFPSGIVSMLGIPGSSTKFYPSILGAVFLGIATALVIGGAKNPSRQNAGLGLYGAIAINLCGGGALAFWLIFGNLDIPIRGYLVLWLLVAALVGLSVVEFLARARSRKTAE